MTSTWGTGNRKRWSTSRSRPIGATPSICGASRRKIDIATCSERKGFEYHLLALGIAITLMIVGGGAWSLDGALASARKSGTVDDVIQFLVRHGGAVLFGVVFTEQIGLPLPAVPVLLAAGALAGSGKMSLALAVGLPITAALLADLVWYYLGRFRGGRVLNLLCRISLEPDSCVRRTEDVFARHGARSLLVAKFVPGLNTAAPPLAGIFGMKLPRFVLYDGLGAAIWAALSIGLGYLFTDQLELVAAYALELGVWLALILLGGLAAYIAWKYIWRQRFLRQLRVSRIAPEELKQKLDSGDGVMILDLRQRLDFESVPYAIPGALRLSPEEIEHRHHEIPRDREIVLYCS